MNNNRPVDSRLQVFYSDGELSEPLSARFLRESGAAPNLQSVVRCSMHAAQRSLEAAIQSCSEAKELLHVLVTAYSAGRSGQQSDMGGLARAIRNSDKLQCTLKRHTEAVAGVDTILQKAHSMNFAPQRFDTILTITQHIALHAGPLVSMVTDTYHADPDLRQWCKKILAALSPQNLVFVALLAELSSCAARYVHAFDAAKKSRFSSMTQTAALLLQLKQELKKLFSFQDGPGAAYKEPLCLSERYTAGYLQILQRSYNLLVEKASCAWV